MKKDDQLLWADLVKMAKDVGDDFMDPLSFNSTLIPSDPSVYKANILMNPLIGQHFYDQLIQEFLGQGYTEGTSSSASLFTFPYDWRYGVTGVLDESTGKTTVDLLKEKISSIIQQTGSAKVDVVAHSTGGLLVKKYVMENASNHNIGKAVFVGVPNLGAPKAYKVLLEGDGFGVPWLADSEMKKLSQNFPVVYDLAPSDKYFSQKKSPIKILSGKIFKDTEKELTFSEVKDYLLNEKKLNSLAIEKAHSLHTTNFDSYDLRTAGVDLYNIVGCKTGTLTQMLDFQKPNGEHIRYDYAEPEPGDGTVPLESATNLPVDQAHKFFALKADHGKMPSQNGIRQTIVNVISGSSLNVDSSITQDITKCKLKGKAISVFSPLDIEVTDQDGNFLGFASDGSVQNDIPQAEFSFAGEHKFLYLPDEDGQTYTIKVRGTGSGIFTLKIKDLDNGVESASVFTNIPVTTDLVGNLKFSNSGTSLELDNNHDGQIDSILYPSILNQNQTADIYTPISTLSLSGKKNGAEKYIGAVQINILTGEQIIIGRENETSGILEINYRLDAGDWKKATSTFETLFLNSTSTLPSVSALGKHKLEYYAVDKAGNIEDTQEQEFEIIEEPKVSPPPSGGGGYVLPVILPIATSTLATTTKISIIENKIVGEVLGSSKYFFTKTLRFGSRGEDVKKLQEFLNTQGFLVAKYGNGSVGKETKYFGPLTRSALIRFQKYVGLKPSGVLDTDTLGYINFN
jgi:hypothetical protein